ncbi:MAG: 5-deoxy-glucuronate isomerase [Clostridia bacterium]|nr:5-deoxy-glucuronate isomerase [Clostridia bacterium]MDE7079088.1 5-deoxy-glucuronate isomerase [Clostridia bacterium]
MAFNYPKFNKKGVKTLAKMDGKNKDMMMDILVVKLAKGESVTYSEREKEMCVLLTEGAVEMKCKDLVGSGKRSGVFDDLPICMHVSKGNTLTVTALEESEIIYLATTNDREFESKFYDKKDVIVSVSCEGLWENTAVRDVNTIFDYSNAPYSNLVVGEVLARQGRWWSYLPHSHPQPEVYYYKMPKPEAFGACFIGEMEPHTIVDGSVGCFPGGKTHVQVTAPGYPMYCCWMIRHLDGNPWDKTRIVDPRYEYWEK